MAAASQAPLLFTRDFTHTPTSGPSSPCFLCLGEVPSPPPRYPRDSPWFLHLSAPYQMPFLVHLSSLPSSLSHPSLFSPEHLQSSHIPAITSFIILLSVFPTGLWVPSQQRHLSSLFKEASTGPDCTKSSINLLLCKWIWMNECPLYK